MFTDFSKTNRGVSSNPRLLVRLKLGKITQELIVDDFVAELERIKETVLEIKKVG